MPPWDPPDMGNADSIAVAFPLNGWSFNAEYRQVGVDCPRSQRNPVESTGANTFLVEPAGRAGTYDVTLFGRGPGGDLFVSFHWTTPRDGPMPVPEASLSVLANHDGEVDSYGVELSVGGLADTPSHVVAQITVSAANGSSLTFEPDRERGCQGAGAIFWNGPKEAGLQAASLGPAPFTYDVLLELDGVTYSASAIWPDAEVEGSEPAVSLEFSPPLPALR